MVSQEPQPGSAVSGIVGARACGVVLFGAGLAEVERNHGGDARVERGGDGGGVAAPGHGADHDDALGVDVGALEQHIDAAHEVPDPSTS